MVDARGRVPQGRGVPVDILLGRQKADYPCVRCVRRYFVSSAYNGNRRKRSVAHGQIEFDRTESSNSLHY